MLRSSVNLNLDTSCVAINSSMLTADSDENTYSQKRKANLCIVLLLKKLAKITAK